MPLVFENMMQFVHRALDRVLREILLANPKNGCTKMLKVSLSDGFYRLGLNILDIPKLGEKLPTHMMRRCQNYSQPSQRSHC